MWSRTSQGDSPRPDFRQSLRMWRRRNSLASRSCRVHQLPGFCRSDAAVDGADQTSIVVQFSRRRRYLQQLQRRLRMVMVRTAGSARRHGPGQPSARDDQRSHRTTRPDRRCHPLEQSARLVVIISPWQDLSSRGVDSLSHYNIADIAPPAVELIRDVYRAAPGLSPHRCQLISSRCNPALLWTRVNALACGEVTIGARGRNAGDEKSSCPRHRQ